VTGCYSGLSPKFPQINSMSFEKIMKKKNDKRVKHTHKFRDTHKSPAICLKTNEGIVRLFDNHIQENSYVTAEGLAKALSLSIHTIRKWRKQQKITGHKFGRSVRYCVDEVLAEIE
jgi:DNA invertase Pin-like site-specific DNA recombinase